MDIRAKITEDDDGYIVDAFMGDDKYHVTVMHPDLEKAWETISTYVLGAWRKSEEEQ